MTLYYEAINRMPLADAVCVLSSLGLLLLQGCPTLLCRLIIWAGYAANCSLNLSPLLKGASESAPACLLCR